MFSILVCSAMLAAGPEAPSAEVRQAYQDARSHAGRSSEDQVRLALWCEAHGLTSERLHHLALAVLSDPANVRARGLMGLVAYQGRWQRPEAVADRARADARLAEYEALRMRTPYTADGQWRLGLWSEEKGLTEQAKSHLTAVIRLDPSREAAWKKLGYRKFDGRWRTDVQVAAEKAEAEARDRADRRWSAMLGKWKAWLESDAKRPEAEAGLDGVTDPFAVGAVMRVLGGGRTSDQSRAVRVLGQIDAIASSRALAVLATWGKSLEVRRASAEILAHRDPRESVGFLIGRLRAPIRYDLGLRLQGDGLPHPYLFVEGKKYNLQIDSAKPFVQSVPPRLFADSVPFDPYGQQASWMFGNRWSSLDSPSIQALVGLGGSHGAGHPSAIGHGGQAHPSTVDPANAMVYGATIAASARDAQIALALSRPPPIGANFQAQTIPMMAEIDTYNTSVVSTNTAIYASLGQITGQDLPSDPEAWKAWWVDSLGYAYKSSQSAPAAAPKLTYQATIISCFAAGTTIRTMTGDRPIESIKIGDQVLAQDTATGALSYRSIASVHHNPPSPTLRVTLGDEVIVATGFHRFWKAGRGWVMARELKPGDTLRALGGLVRVSSVADDRVQPVFNLDVADDADFFVGKLGALVHDNSLPDPRLAPFDAATGVVGPAP